jgi:hypothetical protein
MTSLVKKGLWKLRKVLTNLEVEMPKDANGKTLFDYDYDEDTNQITDPELVGRVGIAVVKMGSYQGKERSEVDNILSIDGVDLEQAIRSETKTARAAAPVTTNGAEAPRAERKMNLR